LVSVRRPRITALRVSVINGASTALRMPKLMSFSGAHWKNRRTIRRSTMAEASSPGERTKR
jgi:hypothetical protein